MSCPDYGIIGENLTFTIQAKDGTGAPVDTDALPTYSVYEDETGTAIVDGSSMAKLDDAGTTGFYSEQLAITDANGYELYKTYSIRVSAAISTISVAQVFSFMCVGSTVVPSATSGALTTYANVKLYLGLANDNNQTLIESLITRATKAIQNYTGRTLLSTVFRERYDSLNEPNIVLKEYPVTAIDFVSNGVLSALSLINTSSDAYRAGVEIEDSTLASPTMTLEVYGGGNDGSNSITLSDHATLNALVTNINNTVASGWTAAVYVSDYGTYDPIELLPTGRLECLDSYAYPQIPNEPLGSFKTYLGEGVIRLPVKPTDGLQNIIVKYTAGYATTPADLEQACIDLVKFMFDKRLTDGSLKSEKLGDYAYTSGVNDVKGFAPEYVMDTLSKYKKASHYAY